MKRFLVFLFLCSLLYACEKTDIQTDATDTDDLEYIDDSNDLDAEEAEFLADVNTDEARSRTNVPKIESITLNNSEYLSESEICYAKYVGYAKYPYNTAQRFIIEGTNFGDAQGNSTIETLVRFNKWDEIQNVQIVAWSNTTITVDITNNNMGYKNVLLKFAIRFQQENGSIRTSKKSIRVSAGIPYALTEADGSITEGIAYYPQANWQMAYYQGINEFASYSRRVLNNGRTDFHFSQLYEPKVGDIILSEDRTRVGYITELKDKTSAGNQKFKFHQRNKKCQGRSSHRTYTGLSTSIRKKSDDEDWTIIYRAN